MTTWVLLRGLMRETRHWGEFPGQFQSVLEVQHLVTLDFPGNGDLHELQSATRVTAMAFYCHTHLRQLGYAPPYRVLALSLGAMVAVEWSEHYPTDIEKLVLINTSLAPHNPFYHRLRPANYFALLRSLLCGSLAQREELILRLTSNQIRTQLQQGRLLQQWTHYARQFPVTRVNIFRQLRAALTYRAPPHAPPVPVLLLAAQHDRLVDVKCSLSLAARWNCAIRLHPTAGHDLPLDDGVWVAQQIKAWLAV